MSALLCSNTKPSSLIRTQSGVNVALFSHSSAECLAGSVRHLEHLRDKHLMHAPKRQHAPKLISLPRPCIR